MAINIDALHRVRKEKKLKQADVAFQIDVSAVTFSKYESGITKPTIDVFEKWLDALGYEMTITSKPVKL